MSRHILRRARLPQSLCSASVPLAHRRCYSALPAFKPSPAPAEEHHDPVPGPSHHVVQDSMTDPPADGLGWQRLKTGRVPKADQMEAVPVILDLRQRQTGAEAYLSSLHAAGLEPTLADLERCRPEAHAHPESPQYPLDYNGLIDTLCRSFSKEQLRMFLVKCNIGPIWSRQNRTKLQYAESIVEKLWGWPCLKEVERAKRDRTEVSVKSFPVNPTQLFLLLGKDGADMLDMSMTYNVHISLTTEPLALRVEGIRGSLKKLTEHINAVRRAMVEVLIELPTKAPIRPDMIQRISRLAGAYLQNVGSRGKLRICARNARQLEIAKRLASRAAHEIKQNTQAPLLSYLPGASSSTWIPAGMLNETFSLYPFLSPRPLPWTMNTGGAFRVRRVGEWLGPSVGEDFEHGGGLAGGQGQILTTRRRAVDLKTALLSVLPDPSDSTHESTTVVKASMGHMLFTTTSPGQRPTIVPPLKGQYAFGKILEWIAGEDVRSSFVSSLPGPLVDSSPAQQKMLHRLTYHAIPQSGALVNPDRAQVTEILSFEAVLSQPQPHAGEGKLFDTADKVEETSTDDAGPDVSLLDPASGPRCWKGVEAKVDVMMPARSMDMRLSALQSSVVPPGQEPPELQVYMANIRAFLVSHDGDAVQPDPPLIFTHDGVAYILHTSASVRQSVEYIKVEKVSDNKTPAFVQAVSESILDLESNQKMVHCEIICNDLTSEESWKNFLGDCDNLSSMTYKPMGTITIDQPSNIEGR